MDIQFKKGVLSIGVLALLTKKDRYGYELVSKISERIPISEGTIYPILHRMKKDNLVETYLKESSSGPPRKYYKLTEDGTSTFKEQTAEWQSFSKQINLLIKQAK